MAQYDHLPVFKVSYDLLLAVYQTPGTFGREYKYTIGENLKKEVLELIVKIYKANGRQDKREMIAEAKEHLEVARLYMRIAKDLKQITLKKMIFLNEFIESIAKQLAGWEKSVNQNNAGIAAVTAGASVLIQSNSPPRK
jgi:hypothetical protein